jgi:hypothetical protein
VRVDSCGLGAVLIHRQVLQQVRFRSDASFQTVEEFYFGTDCRQAGIEIFVDTGFVCEHHLYRKRDEVAYAVAD